MKTSALAFFLTTVSLGSCASSDIDSPDIITEERKVSAFTSVALNGIGTVRLHQGPRAVRIRIDEALAERFETVVKDGTLYLGFKCSLKPSVLRAIRKLKYCEVDVTVPELRDIELNGAGSIIADSFDYGSLRVAVAGAASIELQGSAESLELKSTGDARITTGGLSARGAVVAVTGSGRVEVRAEERLDASVTGAGTLAYWGNPAVTQRISGAGTITRLGD